MAWGNAGETSLMALLFTNTALANVGNSGGLQPSGAAGSFYVALHNAAPAVSSDQTSHETAYTNYAREGVARTSGGWTLTGNAPAIAENAAAITWPQCGASGDTLTNFSVGLVSSGASQMWWNGGLAASLTVANGITPSMAINALQLDFT